MTQEFYSLKDVEYCFLINESNSVILFEMNRVHGDTLRKNTYSFGNNYLITKQCCRDFLGNIIFLLSFNEHI